MVLVILAILAAFTIPAMIGFVNEARSKAEIAEARMVYLAAQSVATETVGTSKTTPTTEELTTLATEIETIASGRMAKMLNSEVNGTVEKDSVTVNANGQVTALTYVGTKATFKFTNGEIEITPN